MSPGPAGPNAAAPPALRTILDAIDRLARIDGWMGATCLAALFALIFAEVLVRTLSNVLPWVPADIPVAWEYGSYLMAAAFTFGAAMTLRAGGHIRVTLLIGRVSPGIRRHMETVLAALGVGFTAFLVYALVNFTWQSFDSGQISISSGTPLWPAQAVVTFGVVLLMLQFVARFLQALFGLPLESLDMRASSVSE